MKIQGLKNVNITVLFSVPLNHLLISQEKIAKLFDITDAQRNASNFVEAPGLKVIILPNQKRDIAFEQSRFIVADKTGNSIEKSTLVDDFRKIFDAGPIDPTTVAAYGFNYDVLVESDGGNLSDIVGQKLLQLPNIKNGGAMVSFEKGGISYALDIKPINDKKTFLAHFNAHFTSNIIPNNEVLKKESVLQFKELEQIIKSI